MRHLHIFWLLLFLQTAREAFCQINTHQHAFQPFRNEASMNEDMQQQTSRTRKVAIIGAGAGGTSAAYFLSKAQDRLENLGMSSESIDVTIFERDERIGGRTTVIHPYHDERLPAIELGASIFADVNKNLKRAAKQFGLSTGAKIGLGAPGVWDGQQFVIENPGDGWWNSAKLFWRYGYSPLTTQKLVRSLVDKFVQLYNPSFMHKQSNQSNQTESGFPWDTVKKMARSLSLDSLAGINAGDHFYQSGVSKLFVEEIIEAATLVNYGQEIYSIHGVGGSVSLAASGAAGVDGGNFRIFEKLLSSCRALRLRLGVHGEVTGLARFQTARSAVKAGKLSEQEAIEQGFLQHDDPSQLTEAGLTTKWWLGTKSGFGSLYDVVFLAAPWHSSGITLLNTEATIPSVSYVRLHVTIVVTTAPQPNPAYFGRGEKDSVPTSILTSHVALRKSDEKPKNSKNSSVWTSWPWGNDTKHGPLLEVCEHGHRRWKTYLLSV